MKYVVYVFFLMIRRPPRSTLDRSSAASDVYKRQSLGSGQPELQAALGTLATRHPDRVASRVKFDVAPVSYTHLRAHETVLDLVCRLLLEKNIHNRLYHSVHTTTT